MDLYLEAYADNRSALVILLDRIPEWVHPSCFALFWAALFIDGAWKEYHGVSNNRNLKNLRI